MALGWGEALALATLLPILGGGKETEAASWAMAGKGDSTTNGGLMSNIFTAGEALIGGDFLLGKFQRGEKASARAASYIPNLEGFLETQAAKGAGRGGDISAVDPKVNDRFMEALLTKYLTSPVYSERIG